MSVCECMIVNFDYNLLVVLMSEQTLGYITFFPPANGTSTAFNTLPGSVNSVPDLSSMPSEEEMASFWLSDDEYQVDGVYKGGPWGSANLPFLNPKWVLGAKLGDKITILSYKPGVVRSLCGNTYFDDADVIPNTENNVWTINFEFNKKLFGGYLMSNVYRHESIDCIVSYKDENGDIYIRCAKRGEPSPTVDIPNKFLIGMGETIEPDKTGSNEFNVKTQSRKGIQEELNIDDDFDDTQIVHIGDYTSFGRDTRYISHSILCGDGKIKKFGVDHESKGRVYLIKYESGHHDRPTKSAENFDNVEIAGAFWVPLYSVLTDARENPGKFMFPEHSSYILEAGKYLLV